MATEPRISVGDLFVVTRGYRYGNDGLFGMGIAERFDRSHDGIVYKAISAVGDSIIVEVVVGDDGYRAKKSSSRFHVNIGELLVQVVPESHVALLKEVATPEAKDEVDEEEIDDEFLVGE